MAHAAISTSADYAKRNGDKRKSPSSSSFGGDKIICPDNRIHHFFWAQDSKTILYFANGTSQPGNEMFHLWSVNAIAILEQIEKLEQMEKMQQIQRDEDDNDEGDDSKRIDSLSSFSPSVRRDIDYEKHIRDLTPGIDVKAQNAIVNPNKPEEIFVGTNKRNQALFDMYRCNIYTGELTLDTVNPGDVISWGVQIQEQEKEPKQEDAVKRAKLNVNTNVSPFEIRWAVAKNQTDGSTVIRLRNSSSGQSCRSSMKSATSASGVINDDERLSGCWKDLYSYPYGEIGKVVALLGETCWITSSCGRDTTALVKIDLQTGEEVEQTTSKSTSTATDTMRSTVFFSEQSDIGDILFDENYCRVLMVSYNYARKEIHFFDKELEGHFKEIVRQGPVTVCDEVRIVSYSRDRKVWLISYEPSDAPNSYGLYRTEEGIMEPLFCSQSRLLQYLKSFSQMEVVSIIARDGLKLIGYLTRSKMKEKLDYDNQPKMPLILLVHGGPWERDSYGFVPIVQWLANRGYNVLQVNFRGSTGFGKTFLHRGDREWGVGKMQHDLTDAVMWCLNEKISEKDKICIFGASYGGYAALSGLCFTPELYKCGVNIAGPNNIKTLLSSIPEYWKPLRKTMLLRIGDVNTDSGFNEKISPFFHTENIVAPVLIVQGANDPRVSQVETEKIVSRLKDEGKEVDYIFYEDEGHNILKPLNRMDLFDRIEKFLAQHLGGRYE
eukprot:CAMPEP_0203666992 /NCGR_PEP_ID=MMETSP0090-20130426/3910_1 /ASSEMBLY_ACC=CAM_ASM_001088 /TAXON_ID=426623 /ORGANISM="Chaetoceros affinis, Strain CCMP159" /LENGTH=718 /DNA_ID=CAMNT_0050531023 /DNA_START=434 /DNA_END=2589 /DNA_ORIENTATION=-